MVPTKGKQITRFYNNLHIALSLTSASHLQTNGHTKATNKNILMSIKKKLGDTTGLWVEELLSTLYAIRKTVHSGIKDTPFNLAFGTDVVIL